MKRSIIFLFAGLVSAGCDPQEKTDPAVADTGTQSEIILPVTSPADSEGKIAKRENAVHCSGKTWLEYNVYIPESGRYRIEFNVKAEGDTSYLWVEDHVHNTEDRTYNITGSIPVPAGDSMVVGRDGSPMGEGSHNIRIHTGGEIEIYRASIELLKKQVPTPLTLIQNMEGEEWEIVWNDEFEKDGLPDTEKWTYDIGNWGWGNNELQYYTAERPENARIEDGHLVIEARKGEEGWTSARLTTREKTSFVYGKIEFRAMVPAEKGNWAAGWTLGDSYVDEASWPQCGEIDILESVGYEMDNATGNGKAHASAHCEAYYFKLGNQPTGIIDVEAMDRQWHTYSVEWTPSYIKAFVDDEHYFTYDDTSTEASWPFSDPQNLILNLTMGGGWGGLQGMDPSVTSQKMLVDYVRVYQKKPSGE